MIESSLKKQLNNQVRKFESDAEDHINNLPSAPVSLVKRDQRVVQDTLNKIARLSNQKMLNSGHLILIDPHTIWMLKTANILLN